jgi:hypothetical protein
MFASSADRVRRGDDPDTRFTRARARKDHFLRNGKADYSFLDRRLPILAANARKPEDFA